MGGYKASVTTFIVEPFVPHDSECYLSVITDRLGCTIRSSEYGGIEIDETRTRDASLELEPVSLFDSVPFIFFNTFGTFNRFSCEELTNVWPVQLGELFKTVMNILQYLHRSHRLHKFNNDETGTAWVSLVHLVHNNLDPYQFYGTMKPM
ncbi:hypothetical protein NE237_016392 [Protea cynaroides]|uniref:Uncharacterized protein n=1 Tax=Protea cynaroides TaxID=273540 RepID=A0A9Q0HDY2_9MAGN|nr:hypothetical protein NE237_016392 [Protea cynaroides]